MFTGIIECLGKVHSIETEGENVHFAIESEISKELKPDESVSHNGVCLTVTKVENDTHYVTAIQETLIKSNLGEFTPGSLVNLERAMSASSRFDGHIVQGHVDQVGICESVSEADGSWYYDFSYDQSLGNITVEKGSICINGVSLTCFKSYDGKFTVAIIPHTYEKTTFQKIKKGDKVNLEFDIIGKYIQRISSVYK